MKRIVLLVMSILAYTVMLTNAQCPTDDSKIKITNYCPNQYAEYTVNDANAANNYRWYTTTGSVLGLFREFVSEKKLASGSGSVSYDYSVEYSAKVGPPSATLAASVTGDQKTSFSYPFDATMDFELQYITVAARLDQNDISYNIQVKIGTSLSKVFEFGKSTTKAAGSTQYSLIRIPVFIQVSKGAAQSIEILSTTTANALAWFPTTSGAFPYTHEAVKIGSNSQSIWGQTCSPAIFDWEIAVKCNKRRVSAVQETNTSNCCTPVVVQPLIESSLGEDVTIPFTSTLTAYGEDDTHYYKWYKDGVAISGAEGYGLTSLTASAIGRYSVREVANATDVGKFSCYTSNTLEIRKKLLFLINDTTICLGDAVKLNKSTDPVLVEWTPATGLDNASSANPTATPTVTTTYTASSFSPSVNLITNPDFSAGFSGFDLAGSGLTIGSTNVGQGQYTIGTDPNPYNSGYFAAMGDHTTGKGQMMIIDVNPSTKYVYQTTIPVVADKKYAFSVWMANISKTFYNPSRLRFIIDGVSLGKIKLDSTSNNWQQFYTMWTATATKDVVITIVNENTDGGGNDLALDDVSFSTIASGMTDKVTITVKDCFTIDAGLTTHICSGDSTRLNPTVYGGIVTEWTPSTGLDKPKSMYPWAKPSATTKYTVTAFRKGTNLVTNPDFELGNSGFTTSGITYNATTVKPGNYSIGTNPSSFNSSSYLSISDHTTGTGKMLIADADPSTIYIYQTSVTVKKGTLYSFSVWAANINKKFTNPGTLQFYVDGTALGGFKLDSGSVWRQFYTLWTATADATVNIKIVNTNTLSKGNDLAIDDVEFAPISVSRTDTMTVIVDNCIPPIDGQKITVCESTAGTKKGVVADLTAWNDSIKEFTTGNIVLWYSDAARTTKITTLTNVTVNDGQKLYVRVTNAAGTRYADSVIDFTVKSLPKIGFATVSSPCAGATPFTLTATPSGGSFSGTNISSTGSYTPPSIATTSDKVSYKVTVNGCENSKDTSITTNGAPSTSLTSTKLSYCGTTSDVNLTVTAVSGATYAWTKDGTPSTASTTNTLNNATKGTYTVTLKKNNCEYTVSDIVVTQYDLPTYQIKGTASYCKGVTPTATSIELTGASPWVVAYKVGSSTKKITVSTSPASLDTLAGTYQLDSMRDAHCNATVLTSGTGANATITVNALPSITFNDPKAVCFNAGNTDLSSYTTQSGGTFSGTNITAAGVFSPQTVGINTFTYTYKDATTTCSSSISKTITVLALPKPSISPKTIELCETKSLAVTASATSSETGASPFAYAWSGSGVSYLLSTTAENNSFSGTSAGTYRILLTVTDKNKCLDTISASVTVFKKPTASISAEKTKVCSYADAFAVTATLSPMKDANSIESFSSWPKAGVVDNTGTFTPATAFIGTNNVVYQYKYKYSANTSCDADSVKTQIEVNERPTVNLSTPKTALCIDADAITLACSPALDANGSITGTGVTSSSFDPKTAKNGTFILTYNYKNPTTECENSDTTKIIVNKKPEIAFVSAPKDVCLKAGTIQLTANTTGVSYTGTGISTDGLFNPKTAGVTTHTIEMTYTDAATGCDSTISHNITVHQTAKPVVTSPVTDVLPIDRTNYTAPDLSATGTNIKWYDNVYTFLQKGDIYKSGKKAAGSYQYWVTQTDDTYSCESDSVEVLLQLSDCPAQAPTATDVDHCFDNGLTAVSISATANDGGKLGWFNASMATSGALIKDNSTSYTPTDKVVGDYPYYVAEWSNTNSCWGPTTKVYLRIHANPEPKITFPAKLCYPISDENTLLPITLTPGGGTASGDGVILDNNIYKFKPTWTSKASSNSEISYSVINEYKCTTVVKQPVAVQYTPAPSTTDVTWMNRYISTLPDLTATGTGSGTIEWWTSTDTSGTPGANPYKTGITSQEIKTYTFYVSEKQNGCRSAQTAAKVNIVDCPTPTPQTTNVTVCENAPSIPSLTASGDNIKWYTQLNGGTATDGATYNHGKTTAGEYRYWVTQTQTDSKSGAACESQRKEVVLTINAKPDIAISGSKSDICFNGNPLTIKATSSHSLEVTNFSGDVIPEANATAKFDPTSNKTTDWIANVKFETTDKNGCSNETSFQINVHYTAPPTAISPVTGLIKPFANAAPQLSADGVYKNFKWYSSANKANVEGTSELFNPLDDNTNPLTKDYYVTQTNSATQCESEPTTVTMNIVNCPVQAPIAAAPITQCVYDANPQLSATRNALLFGNRSGSPIFRWYTDINLKNKAKEGDSTFTPQASLSLNLNEFWVTEYDPTNKCESQPTKLSVTVTKTDAPKISTANNICEGTANPTFSALDASGTFLWYDNGTATKDTIGANRVGSASAFTPSATSIGYHYYMAVRVNNACRSEITQVAYFIHPKPNAPTVNAPSSCYGSTYEKLKANLDSTNFNIKWYDQDKKEIKTQNPYQVSGLGEGTHTFFATQSSSYGCTSDYSQTTYTVNHKPSKPIIDATPICDKTPYPTFTCTNLETGNSLQWLDNNGSTPSANTFTPNDYNSRTIQVKQITTNNCESDLGQAIYTVNPLPATPSFGTFSICEGDTKLTRPLHTNSAFSTITWYADNNFATKLSEDQNFTPNPLPSETTDYFVIITDQNGCTNDKGKATLSVTKKPSKPIISPKPITICEYEALSPIQATGNAVTWTFNKKQISSGGILPPPTKYISTGGTVYFVAVASDNGCQGYPDSVAVSVKKRPSTPLITDKLICWGDQTPTLRTSSSAIDEIHWIDSTHNNNETIDSVLIPQNYKQGDKIKYGVYSIATNYCYSDTIGFTLRVGLKPHPQILGDTTVCYNKINSREFTIINRLSKDSKLNWNTNKMEYENRSDSSITLFYNTPGIDTIYITEVSPDGCIGSDSAHIFITQPATPSFKWQLPGYGYKVEFVNTTISDTIRDNGINIPISNTFKWDFGREDKDTLTQAYSAYEKHTPIEQIYRYGGWSVKLTATNREYGCNAEYNEDIFVDINKAIFIPNVFAPESPSANIREFKPQGFNLETYEISIYDQWGNLMWYSNKLKDHQPQEGWDGTYEGLPAKSDVYIWRINAQFMDGREWDGTNANTDQKAKTYGNILLIR